MDSSVKLCHCVYMLVHFHHTDKRGSADFAMPRGDSRPLRFPHLNFRFAIDAP